MGTQLFDQFSYLHFASGIIAYFWNIQLKHWMIIHILFELIENTKLGMYFINEILPLWPGEKNHPDSLLNSFISDNLFALLGWLSAQFIDHLAFVL